MKKPTFIGGGKPGERHAVLGDDQIYCEWQGAASAPVITHSGVKCEFCRKTLAGLHSSARENPIPKDSFSGSWVVTEKLTGKVVGEFFNQKTVEKINTKKYLVETAGQYLGRINRESRRKNPIARRGVKLSPESYGGFSVYDDMTGGAVILSDGRRLDLRSGKIYRQRLGRGKGLIHNPVPSYAMILRRKLAKGHSQEEAEELARRELQQANIFLSEGRKKNYPRKTQIVYKKFLISKDWDTGIFKIIQNGEIIGKFPSMREAKTAIDRVVSGKSIFYHTSAWKSNPLRRNGPVKIYGQTEKIFMKKTAGPYKGQKFVHDFKGGVRQIGLPRGTKVQFPDGRTARLTTRSVLLDGKKDLWRNFAA
jgi:hypothetical protein